MGRLSRLRIWKSQLGYRGKGGVWQSRPLELRSGGGRFGQVMDSWNGRRAPKERWDVVCGWAGAGKTVQALIQAVQACHQGKNVLVLVPLRKLRNEWAPGLDINAWKFRRLWGCVP